MHKKMIFWFIYYVLLRLERQSSSTTRMVAPIFVPNIITAAPLVPIASTANPCAVSIIGMPKLPPITIDDDSNRYIVFPESGKSSDKSVQELSDNEETSEPVPMPADVADYLQKIAKNSGFNSKSKSYISER